MKRNKVKFCVNNNSLFYIGHTCYPLNKKERPVYEEQNYQRFLNQSVQCSFANPLGWRNHFYKLVLVETLKTCWSGKSALQALPMAFPSFSTGHCITQHSTSQVPAFTPLTPALLHLLKSRFSEDLSATVSKIGE